MKIVFKHINSTLTDMKNRPVFTLHPQGEQAGFQLSSRLCRDQGKKLKTWLDFNLSK
jgi:hypothetical protein